MPKKSTTIWLDAETKKRLEEYSEKNYPYSTSGQARIAIEQYLNRKRIIAGLRKYVDVSRTEEEQMTAKKRGNVGRRDKGACGGDRKRDGSGAGVGNLKRNNFQ